jgi:hypothetical protein
MYSHVLNIIREKLYFLQNTTQNIINGMNFSFLNATDQFIAGWVEEISKKLSRDIDKLMSDPSALSHSAHECLLFEQALVYNLNYQLDTYGAVSDIFLSNESVFQNWLSVELQCMTIWNSSSRSFHMFVFSCREEL